MLCGGMRHQMPHGANSRSPSTRCTGSNSCKLPRSSPKLSLRRGLTVMAVQAAPVTKPQRADLDSMPPISYPKSNQAQVLLPSFGGSPVTISYTTQPVPKLDKAGIQKVKAAAAAKLSPQLQEQIKKLTAVSPNSQFCHPSGVTSPAELALMKDRLARGEQPFVHARDSLLTGAGTPAKQHSWFEPVNGVQTRKSYNIPTDCPINYPGPYPAKDIRIRYSGVNSPDCPCPDSYPKDAPKKNWGHISFVELDSQMAFKQAMAWWATGDDRYAGNAAKIIRAWAETNKTWGEIGQNGPLEAGWGIASMARALELLRFKAPPELRVTFMTWVRDVMMKQLDHYCNDTLNKEAKGQDMANVWANWHSSIIEAMMAVAILSDDRARYDKAVLLYHKTVKNYLWKWGRQDPYRVGRYVGEMTETYRDLFHTQFGLGGLLQTAEMAWQQNDDLYSSNDYAIATAMEFHARIIRGALSKDMKQLPAEFRLFDPSKAPFAPLPAPPAEHSWEFDTQQAQKWILYRTTDKKQQVKVLEDNCKYLVGACFLPTGWEIGYNHYVGRLGIKMPETAALLKEYAPEWYEFHWGLGTLTHANTAAVLWRPGVSPATMGGAA